MGHFCDQTKTLTVPSEIAKPVGPHFAVSHVRKQGRELKKKHLTGLEIMKVLVPPAASAFIPSTNIPKT